jgi:nucleoside-diphosphate-sugar epimerase
MRVLLIGHGYVGSFLRPGLQAAGARVLVCDQALARVAGVSDAVHCRYQDLSINDLANFDAILWFAGHSSVPMALKDPDGAVANNCLDLLHLAKRKPLHTRLIYASTGSVYSVEAPVGASAPPPVMDETQTLLNPVNPYDCSKISFDALARCFAQAVTGLRLGTVCGYSPHLREELIFNAMNCSAMRTGRVRVANRNSYRSVLFLDDLAHYVLRLLKISDSLPPILNAGSFNVSIGVLADTIAGFHGVPIEPAEDSRTYSFRMHWGHIERLCGRPPEVTIEQHCAAFSAALQSVGVGDGLRKAS